jgi:RND family efflux transporter MFP subunit
MQTRNLFFVGACVLTGCSSRPPPKPFPAVRVEVARSASATGGQSVYSAVAQAKATVPLAFRGPGYVTELMTVKTSEGRSRAVGEGDHVKKGDVIARLRDAEYRDKVGQAQGVVAAARAAAEKARLDYQRAQRLFATQSITRPEMESATAQYDSTRAQLEATQAGLSEAQVGLRDTALTIPVDGDVMKKSVEPGAYTGPGTPAFVIGDVSSVKVVLGLPDIALRGVKLGQPVVVTTDALPGRTFAARVNRIAAVADPTTRTFEVEVEMPNPDRIWKPGMIASVVVEGEGKQASPPLLPLTAFVPGPGGRDHFAVLVVDGAGANTRAKLREVELGEVLGNRVAVTRGLSGGEQVITTGASMVIDGEHIELLPSEHP